MLTRDANTSSLPHASCTHAALFLVACFTTPKREHQHTGVREKTAPPNKYIEQFGNFEILKIFNFSIFQFFQL